MTELLFEDKKIRDDIYKMCKVRSVKFYQRSHYQAIIKKALLKDSCLEMEREMNEDKAAQQESTKKNMKKGSKKELVLVQQKSSKGDKKKK